MSAPENTTQVLIIGAGISGLAAAAELRTRGIDCVVLEGRERVGGRIWTADSLGAPFDLGAALIHRHVGNPISALARKAGTALRPTDFTNEMLFDCDGSPVPADVKRKIYRTYDAILKRAKSEFSGAARDRSIASGMKALRQAPSGLNGRIWRRAEQAKVLDTGEDFSRLSLRCWDVDGEFAGPDVLIKGGYARILRQLSDGVDVRLGARVSAVHWKGKRGHTGIRVRSTTGVFEAQAVLVTLPLGVLKAGSVKFDPPLPVEKRRAIARIGVASLNKVVLRFPRIFWPRRTHYFAYLPRRDSRCGEIPEFMNQVPLDGSPVLAGLLGGRFSREAEGLRDDEVVGRALGALRTMFGTIPDPDGALVTRWDGDRFARGAYSYMPVHSSYDELDRLAAPLERRLFFAGEATHREYLNTTHGAYLSGLREARRIAASLIAS